MSRLPLYEVRAFEAALRLSRLLPRPVARALGSGLGQLLCRRNRPAQGALHANLRAVTGRNGFDLDRLCRNNAAGFGRMLADYFYCTTASPEEIRRQITAWEGREHLERARASGRGTIIITAHLGNWELGALILALDGMPMTIVTLEEPTTELTRWRRQYRERLNIKTIAVGGDTFAFVEMINTLRRNELLAMLVDRPYAGSGTPVEFFGRTTQFSSGPALLHQHTGAAVIPAFVVRNGSTGYRSFIEPEIPLEEGGDAASILAANTQRIASRFETIIRQYPEQWFNYVPIWPENSPQR